MELNPSGIMIWGAFLALIVTLLLLDLGVFHRRARAQTFFEAAAWSAFWIALAAAFNALVYFLYENNWVGAGMAFPEDVSGRTAALEFLTGYLLEKTLSLDNIFVIALIFSHFRIPVAYQHRVLFWGLFGALIMRGVMIAAGAAAIHRFTWVTYVFGTLVLITAARLMVVRHDNIDPSRNIITRLVSRFAPVTDGLRGQRFIVAEDGRRCVTPLFVALLMVEGTDLLFAVDSVPAVFAVTDDPFLVYSSNTFALLGLRSLYFTLAPLVEQFRFVRPTLVLILAFIGFKMLAFEQIHLPAEGSLAVIAVILLSGILASVLLPTRPSDPLESPVESHRLHLFALSPGTARRVLYLVVAGTALAAAAALLFVPELRGPVAGVGLALLVGELLWARRYLARRLPPVTPSAE